ncbi:SDR family oxidoreductase [Rivibacter subsaxonicus]|uniref:Short-subunit dehydrogenase n=1 Tax=Rivibacter subsaxonicus TaxID=457575 RepID=A0A4Q7VNC6_9BURK|nr:SDR family oxidoreductase [Rivibacter subsaxonicus]RZT97860.1 short-subunit dehydrogenase [Rivibacter subsaxonicus]
MKAAQARVLLTGAGGGIGQAMAAALVQAGAAVMLVGRSGERLAAQAAALRLRAGARSPELACVTADLLAGDDLARLGRAAADWDCNVVIHNAGVPSFGRLQSLDADAVARVLDTNLRAPILLTQALLPHLLRRPRAQVICVGSALGRIGLPGFSVYSASKFGLRGFAEALRRELADSAVRVQYLGPRSTRTGFNSAELDAYNLLTGTATDAPETVAAALLRLLEDEVAERFIGMPEAAAVRLNGLAPTLLDGGFDKHRRHLPPIDERADDAAPNTALQGART